MKNFTIFLLLTASLSAFANRESGGRIGAKSLFVEFLNQGSGIDHKTYNKYKLILKQEKDQLESSTSKLIGENGERLECVQFKDYESHHRSINRIAASIKNDKYNRTKLYAGSNCEDFKNSSLQNLKAYEQSIVFIHGAHFDKRSFFFLGNDLEKMGVNSVSLDLLGRDGNPAITLDMAARDLCNQLSLIKGRKLIVAHSQGGAVVNQAASHCSGVIRQIVYLAAVVPLEGETVYQKLSKEDEGNYLSTVELVNGTFSIKNVSNFLNVFAQDIHGRKQSFVLFNVKPEGALIGEAKVTTSASFMDGIEKFYIKTILDKVISIKTQEAYIDSVSMKDVFTLESGHLPMISVPAKLAVILEELM